jgi:hypothetical protein
MLASYSLPFDTRMAVNPFNPNIRTATKLVSSQQREKEEKIESIETERQTFLLAFRII